VKVLKGSLRSGAKSSVFRKVMVVLQFSLSIFLIIGTGVIYNQLEFIQNKKLGYDKDHLLYTGLNREARRVYPALKEELLKNPKILGVTTSSSLPTYMGSSTSGFTWEGQNPDETLLLHTNWVDFDFIETMKMEMVQGRSFSPDFVADTANSVIVNEEAVRIMGLENPLEARFGAGNQDLKIVGVVKDFHFKSVHTRIEPLVMAVNPDNTYLLMIRVHSEDISSSIASIEQTWNKLIPDNPFEYRFLDEDYDNLYKAEANMGRLVNYFSILAIFIACLGLFGLASFTAEQRTKEIGIRKVLGASVPVLTVSMCKEFIKLVLVANILAWPAAYYAMNGWLNNFAYRTALSYDTFVLAGFLAIIIAIITVGYQALKAARSNPVDSIRYE
jgi:hypothetical protein